MAPASSSRASAAAEAEQQMLEGAIDTNGPVRRLERQRSLNLDEPDEDLDRDDPVPPKGA